MSDCFLWFQQYQKFNLYFRISAASVTAVGVDSINCRSYQNVPANVFEPYIIRRLPSPSPPRNINLLSWKEVSIVSFFFWLFFQSFSVGQTLGRTERLLQRLSLMLDNFAVINVPHTVLLHRVLQWSGADLPIIERSFLCVCIFRSKLLSHLTFQYFLFSDSKFLGEVEPSTYIMNYLSRCYGVPPSIFASPQIQDFLYKSAEVALMSAFLSV